MINLTKIVIKNLLSVGNIPQTIHLSFNGLTLVVGENVDVGGGNSRNGVGKTSLMQAISYALYGEPLTKIKLDNLVNNINGKGMLVTISFGVDGKDYVIERGRKPNILKFYIDGESNDAKGENKNTQLDIEKTIGMSHLMFKNIVALNTYTEPFMRMKAAEQREIIEELLGITQLSHRAETVKSMVDLTKEALRDEEAKIKANIEANGRIEQAIVRVKSEAEVWQEIHDKQIKMLSARIEQMSNIDIDAEIALFEKIEQWLSEKKEYDSCADLLTTEISKKNDDINRINNEINRYKEEIERVDSGEIARLEAQLKRYVVESNEDATPQVNRLLSEAARRRKDADNKIVSAEKIAGDLILLQEQFNNPNSHSCNTCGQGLVGTNHLAKVMSRLEKQIGDLTIQAQQAMDESDQYNTEADAIEAEAEQARERHAVKKEEALGKIRSIKQDIEVAKTVLLQQKESAKERLAERQEMLSVIQTQKKESEASISEIKNMIETLGKKPTSDYESKDVVLKLKKDKDAIYNQLELETNKPNIHLSKIEGLQSTLIQIDYDMLNDLTLRLKHEIFLHKLLTAKDSFIRKKIVDQNLMYLNKRLNHYLEKLGLPHEIRFMPDLTIEITLLGRELDFEQLSRGEMNRAILSTWWAFRDVWESLNNTFSLMCVDEVLDFGLDDQGAEAALHVLKSMTMDRNKSVFLISHKENLIGKADRIMLVKKEDQFTTFNEDYSMAV